MNDRIGLVIGIALSDILGAPATPLCVPDETFCL